MPQPSFFCDRWRAALREERMEQQRIDSLPAIHTGCFFMGTVDRRKLTASLILAVIQRLDGAGQ